MGVIYAHCSRQYFSIAHSTDVKHHPETLVGDLHIFGTISGALILGDGIDRVSLYHFVRLFVISLKGAYWAYLTYRGHQIIARWMDNLWFIMASYHIQLNPTILNVFFPNFFPHLMFFTVFAGPPWPKSCEGKAGGNAGVSAWFHLMNMHHMFNDYEDH